MTAIVVQGAKSAKGAFHTILVCTENLQFAVNGWFMLVYYIFYILYVQLCFSRKRLSRSLFWTLRTALWGSLAHIWNHMILPASHVTSPHPLTLVVALLSPAQRSISASRCKPYQCTLDFILCTCTWICGNHQFCYVGRRRSVCSRDICMANRKILSCKLL